MKRWLRLLELLLLGIDHAWSFTPSYNYELQNAVDEWLSDKVTATDTYGHISTWDTSLITNMMFLFEHARKFNDDITLWDVSKVASFYRIFHNASKFNQNIGLWNTSSAVEMHHMGGDPIHEITIMGNE